MAIQHRSQITTAISRLNQSAYGTRKLFSDDYRRIISDTQEVAEWSQQFADDAGYDQGSDLPQEMWLLSHSSGFPVSPDFCFQDAGFLLKDALGTYAVSQLDSGPYQHTFTPLDVDTTRQLPSRTMMKRLGGLGLYVYRDMRCMNFRLSGGKIGRLKMAATYRGSGHVEKDPSSFSMPAIVDDREYVYAQQVVGGIELAYGGTAQVETATPAGTASTPGNAQITLTSANVTGSPITLNVALTNENAAAQAAKYRAALRANRAIHSEFIISGTSTVILTDRKRRANDATLNLAIAANGTGITDVASSANTTAGTAATSSQSYACDLETWEFNLDNPAVEEGYRQCGSFLTEGDPESGLVRSEDLLGVRNYMLNFTARLNSNDPLRTYMNAGTDLRVRIPIFGTDTNDHSLVITHDRARISSVNEVSDVGGFIGISGTANLMATSGVIGLTATLINNVASYSS